MQIGGSRAGARGGPRNRPLEWGSPKKGRRTSAASVMRAAPITPPSAMLWNIAGASAPPRRKVKILIRPGSGGRDRRCLSAHAARHPAVCEAAPKPCPVFSVEAASLRGAAVLTPPAGHRPREPLGDRCTRQKDGPCRRRDPRQPGSTCGIKYQAGGENAFAFPNLVRILS